MKGNRILVAATGVALVMAACGGDDDTADQATTTVAAPPTTQATTTRAPNTTTTLVSTTQAPTTTASPDTTGADPAVGATLAVAASDLGEILVDGDGFTLYLFGLDEGGVSACSGPCADSWPPVTAPASAGDGVDESLLASAGRDDGTVQVTYNGHPLYRFAGDQEPGDTAGQGINDVWYVVTPAGEPVTRGAAEEGVDGY